MLNYKKVLASCVFLLLSNLLLSQNWMNKQENKEGFNFEEISNEFESYWEGKEVTKGCGYKPFKRWQYRWDNLKDTKGQKPTSGTAISEFNTYLRKHDASQDVRSTWESLGPNTNSGGYSGSGRINAIAFHPMNSDIIYAGSAGGGLWKTTNGGQSWSPKTDFIGSIGISKIVVHPTNPDIVYIATGDGDASDSYTTGVMKSEDGGDTWSSTGLDWSTSSFRLIREMVMDPNDSNILMIASNIGLIRTTNGGETWFQEQIGNFYDVEINPDPNNNIFYAATKNAVYRSTDSGNNWTTVQAIEGSNRLAIATSEDNSNYVYVVSSKAVGSGYNGLWRSTDSGATFTNMSTTPNILGWDIQGIESGGQGWYDLVIAADPNNANTVYVGGINTWKSLDGGATWSIVSHWQGGSEVSEVHADKHELEWQGNVLWEGNDGGIYKSLDGGASWTDLTSDMIISQMYRIGVSELDNKVVAGLQDNGSKQREVTLDWFDEVGGDGMNCAINPDNSSVMYACKQNGEIRRSTDEGVTWVDIQNNIAGQPTGAWVTPYELNPQNPSTIIAAYEKVYRSYDQGNTWETIAYDIGGVKKSLLAISPQDSNYIYVGTTNALWQTTDGGASWEVRTTPGVSTKMIKVSPSSPNTLYATRSSYGDARVYKSIDGGSTWMDISGSLPNIPANSIEIHNDGNETLYVGLDIGVYYRGQTDEDWILYNAGLPNTPIFEIEIKEQTNELYVATYGRGAWKNNAIGSNANCQAPLLVSLDGIEGSSANISWIAPMDSPEEGYEIALTQSTDFPQSGESTMTASVTYDDLIENIDYYFYIRSKCSSNEKSSWSMFGPISRERGCGSTFHDTGGASSNYANNEDESYTICPSNEGEIVTIEFTSFNVESAWDALYVHNGNSVDAPLFSSNNGATGSGFPAGGYWGHALPGTFTSTDESGCITVSFKSDGSVNRSGWTHETTCSMTCSNMVQSNEDEGSGSLRDAVDCVEAGTTISFEASMNNEVISLQNKIVIDKEVIIMAEEGSNVEIAANSEEPVFEIIEGGSLTLVNITVRGGMANDGSAIINQGALTLNAGHVKGHISHMANSLLINSGAMVIANNSVIE